MPVCIARLPYRLPLSSRSGARVACAAILLLIGCNGLQDAVANGDTRSLTFRHTHRDDSLTVTFKRDGRYDDEALKKLNYFLRDWRTDEATRMDPQLFDILWEVYRAVGAREPINIVSSYRSPRTNAMLRRRSRGVAQYSQHTLGKAMDYFIPGVALSELRAAGLRLQRGGVGFYPSSGSPFVHMDTGSIRHWPRMTHDQLARVFPDGKTVHIPTDGRPLSNYHVAMAEVERRGGRSSGHAVSPVRTASADQSSTGKRSIFAKLLGIGSDEEEDSAPVSAQRAPAPGPRVASVASTPRVDATAPAPRVLAAATRTESVPMPRSRPQQPQQQAQTNSYQLASANSRPYQPAPVQGSASDAVQSRYEWREGPQAAAAPAPAAGSPSQVPSSGAIGNQDQRFTWLTGPDGRPAVRPQSPVGPVVAASADPDWLPTEGNDRVAPDVALSYASNSSRNEPETRSTTKQAMGGIRPVPARVAAVAPPPPARQPASTVKVGQRFDDPWLRGLVIAPSMAYSMQVVKFGPQDFRSLRSLMEKPRQSIALVFSYDPHLGVTPGRFSGPAVAFLPTISFGSRTAGLN